MKRITFQKIMKQLEKKPKAIKKLKTKSLQKIIEPKQFKREFKQIQQQRKKPPIKILGAKDAFFN